MNGSQVCFLVCIRVGGYPRSERKKKNKKRGKKGRKNSRGQRKELALFGARAILCCSRPFPCALVTQRGLKEHEKEREPPLSRRHVPYTLHAPFLHANQQFVLRAIFKSLTYLGQRPKPTASSLLSSANHSLT